MPAYCRLRQAYVQSIVEVQNETLTEYHGRVVGFAGTLYAGNPQRETAHPTTERLLRAFREITLSVVRLPDQTIRHVTPLSHLQRRILELLALPASIYEHLALPIESIPP